MSTSILTDEQCLEAALDADPADWDARRALADLLLERGDEAGSECLQWQVENRRVVFYARWSSGRPSPPVKLWAWGLGDGGYCRFADAIPPVLFQSMRAECLENWFPTRREADAALRAAWAKLTPAEREECWKWEGK